MIQFIMSKDNQSSDVGKTRITREGYNNFIEEKNNLSQELINTNNALNIARNLGDFSENHDYHSAKAEINRIKNQIDKIEKITGNCNIVDTPVDKDMIYFGSSFIADVDFLSPGITCTIVGEVEADTLSGKFSEKNKIGESLLGKKKGDIVKLDNGSVIKIISII